MKLAPTLAFVLALTPAMFCQQTQDEAVHMMRPVSGTNIGFTATTIDREAPALNYQPSVLHLKGNVIIRMPVANPAASATPSRFYIVIYADEADCHEDTGEIQPRGNVRMTFELPGRR